MNKMQSKHLESVRKTAKNVENLMNTLGFKAKNEVTKTSFLITPRLQSLIRSAKVTKQNEYVCVSFFMRNGKIHSYPLVSTETHKTDMLNLMARKETEITNLNHLTCHQENGQIYYSFNR